MGSTSSNLENATATGMSMGRVGLSPRLWRMSAEMLAITASGDEPATAPVLCDTWPAALSTCESTSGTCSGSTRKMMPAEWPK